MKTRHTPPLPLMLLLVLAAGVPLGCRGTYYSFWEKFGYEKRDLLVSSVKDARDAQESAKEQFSSALEQFQSLVGVEAGEAAKQYSKVDAAFAKSQSSADKVREQIDEVEQVGGDLFKEWSGEIETLDKADNRRKAQGLWDQSHDRFEKLLAAMHRAEAKMEPVLEEFGEQRVMLKSFANAEAVASLEGLSIEIQTDIQSLIDEMQAAIDEADSFIQSKGS